MKFKIGESVAVKTGVADPDFGSDISGWQGRIEEVDPTGTVFIRWDSLTLKQMGLDLAIRCEEKNFDWEVMTLELKDVEKISSRDDEADVEKAARFIRSEIPEMDA